MKLRHDLDSVADAPADLAPGFQRNVEIAPRNEAAAVVLGVGVEGPDLHRGVAFFKQALRQFVGAMHEGDLVVVAAFGLRRRLAHAQRTPRHAAGVVVVAGAGVVGADAVARQAAEQRMNRLIERLADDIPERDVHHGCGTDLGTAAGKTQIASHQVFAMFLDLPRILAQQVRRNQIVKLCFHRLRATRGFAQTHQPLVGMDLRQQQVGAFRQAQGFDCRDFHCRSIPYLNSSALMPRARTRSPQRLVSARICARNSSGVPPPAFTSMSANCLRTAGSDSASLNALFKRSMMRAGVFCCAITPNHGAITKSRKPASCIVGTSGRRGERCAPVIASARNGPAFMCGRMEGVLSKNMSICPPRRSMIAGAEPRYDTWRMSMPAACLNSSPDRCGLEP